MSDPHMEPGTLDVPLSSGQRALWFLSRLAPESPAYTLSLAFLVRSELDTAALARALAALAARHPALCATIHDVGGRPVQRVSPEARVELFVEAAAGLGDAALGERLGREAERPFDLAAGPLLRALVVTRGPRDHGLLLAVHHTVADFRSLEVIARDLGALYAAAAGGPPAALPPLAAAYGDGARREAELLAGAAGGRLAAAWRERLGGELPVLELPADHPRPPAQTFRGAAVTTAAGGGLPAALRAFAHGRGATLFTALYAGFAALLHRLSGQEEVLVGSPTAGRSAAEAELVGYFVNPVALRTDLAGDPTFAELLDRARRTLLDALEHRGYPFPRLVEALQPQRDASRSPVFQAMLALERPERPGHQALAACLVGRPGCGMELGGLALESLALDGRWAQLDLTLMVAELDGELAACLRWSSDLFDAATGRRMAGQLHTLLAGIVADPGRRLSELPLLSAAERHQARLEWNDTRADLPLDLCLHELFAARAAQAPDAIALLSGDRQLTYAGLAAAAGRLAGHLAGLGAGPGRLAGIFLPRSPEQAVAVLAVLAAGGAYVPLDPSYPAERLAAMLDEVPLVVTVAALADRLPACGARVVRLDAERLAIARRDPAGPGVLPDPGRLAYVIYTSGSTGRPKGVMIDHRGAVNTVLDVNRRFRVAPADRALALSSLSFDLSVYDLFGPFAAGGAVVVPTPEEERDPASWADLARRHRVSIWSSVPALAEMLVEHAAAHPAAAPEALRLVMLSGDWIPVGLPGRLRALAPEARVVSLGGATEASIWSIAHPVDRVEPGWTSIPYGRPMANQTFHVLNAALEPQPVRVPGQLFIGGVGVARGYFRDAERTRASFITHPATGEALYRTGDLGRRLPDGTIELLGRMDQQVKIRGFRIELGEVESALLAHPGVREAAAAVRKEPSGSVSLAAAAVPAPGAELDPAALRGFLAGKLPPYMVPAALAVVGALPLTANGKVDRQALAALGRVEEARRPVAPRTPAEERLAGILAAVLRVDRVGVEDDFFALGGDSILSIQVIARAAQAGLRLTPGQVFRHPTVAGLAAVAEALPAAPTAPVAGVEPASGPVPLTPIQRWFFAQQPPEPWHYNQAMLLEMSPGDGSRVAPAPLAGAVEHLLARHDALRLRFTPPAHDRTGWLQAAAPPAPGAPFTAIDLTALPPGRRRRAIEAAAGRLQASLDLESGPLLRVALFDLGPGRPARLLVAVHHLAVDAVSWRVLVEDLEAAYGQLAAGRPVALPPPTTSFAAWAGRLAAHASSPAARRELGFWRSLPASLPPLPVDHAGEDDQASAARVGVSLGAAETRLLLRRVPAAYRTQAHEVLLAALARAFARWTGRRPLLVEVEGHGREDLFPGVDLSRTVGWFASTFPLLLEAEPDPGTALKAVKERVRSVPGRGIGFGVLRWQGGEAAAELAARPAPEVRLNYLGQLDTWLEGSALFRPAAEAAGATGSRRGRRSHRFEVDAGVVGGRLRIVWTYSRAVYRPATVKALARELRRELRELVAHCLSPEAGGLTPSDVPLAGLDQQQLDALLAGRRGVESVVPLTPTQEGVLFHALAAPGSGVYLQQLVWRLPPATDLPALRRAWHHLVDRHAVLRTAFAWQGLERPLQVVHRQVEAPWEEHDWSGLAEPEERLDQLLAADRRRGFDLAQAPILRLVLVRLAPGDHRLVFSHHHLLLDGWSIQLLQGDLAGLYAACRQGQEPPTSRPRPFQGFIAWLRDQDQTDAEPYWRRTLEGFKAPTPIPIEPPAPRAGASAERRVVRRELPAATTQALQAVGRSHRLTLNTLTQAAWGLFLARTGGEDDVVFGVTGAGRPATLPGAEGMLGVLISTLPLRLRVEPQRELLPWLAELQESQVEQRRFEHSPLAQVQAWSEVPPPQPLFDSLLVFESYPPPPPVGPGGLDLGQARFVEATNYPLTVLAVPGRELRLEASYDPERFATAAVARALGHLATLLEGMAEEPRRRLAELPLLPAAERAQVVTEWNDTATAFPRETLPELLAARVRESPDAVAAVCEGEHWSYRELDRRAARVAGRLAWEGVGPEVVVALLAERGLPFLAAVLGVWKAGGAYLPLDPGHPAERHRRILEQARPAVVVASGVTAALPAPACPVLCLDDLLAGPEPTGALPPRAEPGSLAYVISTSGSTGTPKGAMIEQRGMVNHLHAKVADLALTAADAVAQTASQCFDISVWQLAAPLLAGGRVQVYPDAVAHDPGRLAARAARDGITILETVPSLLREVLAAATTAAGAPLAGLRWMIPTGEALPPDLCRAWAAAYPAVPLLNAYGPTECSDDVTHHRITAGEVDDAGGVSIGRPVANLRLHVLDRALAPLPVGAAGELWVAGAGVGRGYLGDPARTAQAFLPDPFAERPGERMYKTGDLGRRRAGGALELLGRIDHQVKIRGFRIELGEVEAALREHPAIADAVAVARADAGPVPRLVAYAVPAAGAAVAVEALRRGLAQRLPEYMVPARIVLLAALPRTATGKLDRAALPDPGAGRPDAGVPFVAPRTELERALAGIWRDVLRLERVGLDDSFFDAGGHSLLLFRVHGLVRERLGRDVEILDLFRHPTVAALARHLAPAAPAAAGEPGPPPGRRLDRGAAAGRQLRARRDHRADVLRGLRDLRGLHG